jgi:hypothetical protein
MKRKILASGVILAIGLHSGAECQTREMKLINNQVAKAKSLFPCHGFLEFSRETHKLSLQGFTKRIPVVYFHYWAEANVVGPTIIEPSPPFLERTE